jgi:uncharacterized LabA/DUF88 family protein
VERVAIFVDVQNIYYTCREAYGAQFDYGAFWRRVTENREVIEATAFAIDRGDQKQRRFHLALPREASIIGCTSERPARFFKTNRSMLRRATVLPVA